MTMTMRERALLGGRPHRQSWAEIQVGRNQSPETKVIKNKIIKRRKQAKSGVSTNEFKTLMGLVNLEYGI